MPGHSLLSTSYTSAGIGIWPPFTLIMSTILITGATGRQGTSVIKKLLEKQASFTILAVTRDVNSSSARNLARKFEKITLIQGNLNHPAAIFESAKRQCSTPVWGVFSVQVCGAR